MFSWDSNVLSTARLLILIVANRKIGQVVVAIVTIIINLMALVFVVAMFNRTHWIDSQENHGGSFCSIQSFPNLSTWR